MVKKFKIGDNVRLKSNSPLMTIQGYQPSSKDLKDTENVYCSWFAGTKLERDVFHQDSLESSN